MTNLLQLGATDGVVSFLETLLRSGDASFPRHNLEDMAQDHAVTAPSSTLDALLEQNLLQPYGPRIGLSSFGERTVLLLQAIQGADIRSVLRRLRRLSNVAERYELVRTDMIRRFVQSLVERPGFQRLFICSPWLNPPDREAKILTYAFNKALERDPTTEMLVITRPPASWPEASRHGIALFEAVGAKITVNPKLHSKLYIREPGPEGGVIMALVGSKNLTRSENLELGICISGDSVIISDLIAYFFNVVAFSTPYKGGTNGQS